MKTIRTAIIVLSAVVAFSSCANSDKELSQKQAKKLVSAYLTNENRIIVNDVIKLGYYEENDAAARFTLRKLAAAGVINYSVERINKSEAYKSGSRIDWDSFKLVPSYSYYTTKKYFVTVALTPQGQMLPAKHLTPKVKNDPLLAPTAHGDFPEDNVAEEEVFPEDIQKKNETASNAATVPPTVPSQTSTKPAAERKLSDYEIAKQKEHIETFEAYSYEIVVADVRNITADEDHMIVLDKNNTIVENGKIKADFICKAKEVSPFGRVLHKVYEGQHTLGISTFKYYFDRKWVVETADVTENWY